ncbi:cobalt-precorrin-5B (C1)-methyltransferase [Thermodesulforhabdus norvegica]|uniref:Cobalt-precorrin-5B C(1)-methyltransferase n=1 Tax=Thermodesulforhabdus norvegica TaxID=39841 RepID=A0A1I4QWN1_9BACT|nr:cobalt-precorrin-5B (C1)-methyltransferase [Thermodesulforhabdus norvegica]
MTAAAVGALRVLVQGGGVGSFPVAVFLPCGIYFPVSVTPAHLDLSLGLAVAEVKKDGGDDPDVTHGAIFSVELKLFPRRTNSAGVYLKAGSGVGVVTRDGLPVRIGEPAVNPVPRQMLRDNIESFFLGLDAARLGMLADLSGKNGEVFENGVFIPFSRLSFLPFSLSVTVSVPGGEVLARRTLNPRLGIEGGLSILGTTGLVIPYSHEAYRETIEASLKFARTNGLDVTVLSTGGKSEKFARKHLPELPDAAFVQIADFYQFSLKKAEELGFSGVIHSVFFGKLMKMAMGFGYTHAHFSSLDFDEFLRKFGRRLAEPLACQIASANTARQVLDILKENGRKDIIEWIAHRALEHSRAFAPKIKSLGLILFDYDGSVLLRRVE